MINDTYKYKQVWLNIYDIYIYDYIYVYMQDIFIFYIYIKLYI